jgi:hypothetical protein
MTSSASDRLAQASLSARFIREAFLPQMFFWIGYTVILGGLCGEIFAAIFGRARAVPGPAY